MVYFIVHKINDESLVWNLNGNIFWSHFLNEIIRDIFFMPRISNL